MPVEINVDVRGLKQTLANLQTLSNDFGPRKARTALSGPAKKAMAPVLAYVKVNVPKDTLGLSGSIKARGGPPTRLELRTNPNSVYVYRVGYTWVTPGREYFQATAVEYGTRHQSAQPVLRTALSSNFRRIVNTFADELAPAIERRAIQLSKRRRG